MQRKRYLFGVISAVVLIFAASPLAAQTQGKRPLKPEDISRLETIGEAVFSEDGAQLALVITRPRDSSAFYRVRLSAKDGDIWITRTGGTLQNITDGKREGVGYFDPLWSPDGKLLAMHSTKGGNVRVWVWDSRTKTIKQVTQEATSPSSKGPVWISNSHLLVPVHGKGVVDQTMDIDFRASRIASSEWPKAWTGTIPTASVLDSGVPSDYERRPHGRLLKIDVSSSAADELVAGDIREYQLSPNLAFVAALRRTDVVRPKENVPLSHGSGGEFALSIRSLHDQTTRIDPKDLRVFPRTISWSPDSKAVAFYGWTGEPWVTPIAAFTLDVASGRLARMRTDDLTLYGDSYLEAPGLAWVRQGELLVLAKPRDKEAARLDWFRISADGAAVNQTARLAAPPRRVVPIKSGGWAGVAGGKAIKFMGEGIMRESTVPGLSAGSSIAWPTESQLVERIVVAASEKGITKHMVVNLTDDSGKPLTLPTVQSRLTAFNPASESAVAVAGDSAGTRVWWLNAKSGDQKLVTLRNEFLKGIAEGELKQIQYTSLDGEPLKAWLILPPNYDSSKKYPLVADVYAGSVYGDQRPSLTSISDSNVHNRQLLPAHGYILLLPSMPLSPYGVTGDPYLELMKGVMPAIDKAIELEYADANRLGVMGQSYGGYSTYGLITQTKRFKAAVVKAGLSDLISLYGSMDARRRYDDYPHENLFYMSISESSQVRMGNPPWKDAARYMRNSPVLYAERVTTPLLITQGDLDYVSIQQGEEFFNALYRQGKRARFVRYWGEGHSFAAPANINNQWNHIYGWFDEFLK